MHVDPLAFLQHWYAQQCDGDWEHQYGVEIGTIDNPGWRVVVDLVLTALEGVEQERLVFNDSADDWVHSWSDGRTFEAAAGPAGLQVALEAFHSFALGKSQNHAD